MLCLPYSLLLLALRIQLTKLIYSFKHSCIYILTQESVKHVNEMKDK